MSSDALVHARRSAGGAGSAPSWRLVACPPAGAGGGYYRPLARPDVDLWTLRYPGRESRMSTPPAASIPAIADEAVPALRGLVADGPPIVVLGHSMGVGVAIELTRRLVAAGTVPDLLVLSARSAPGPDGAADVAALREITASDATLAAWTIGLGGVPAELANDSAFMAMHLATLRADLGISWSHRPEPATWSMPMLLVCGDADPATDLARMRDWAAFTDGPVTELVLPGGHQAVVAEAEAVLDAARAILDARRSPARTVAS